MGNANLVTPSSNKYSGDGISKNGVRMIVTGPVDQTPNEIVRNLWSAVLELPNMSTIPCWSSKIIVAPFVG